MSTLRERAEACVEAWRVHPMRKAGDIRLLTQMVSDLLASETADLRAEVAAVRALLDDAPESVPLVDAVRAALKIARTDLGGRVAAAQAEAKEHAGHVRDLVAWMDEFRSYLDMVAMRFPVEEQASRAAGAKWAAARSALVRAPGSRDALDAAREDVLREGYRKGVYYHSIGAAVTHEVEEAMVAAWRAQEGR